MSVSRTWHARLAAGFVALLAVGTAACTSSSKPNAGASPSTTSANAAANPATLLGVVHKATGTPVKIGLLTTGGNCSGCTSQNEAPAARAAVGWLNDYKNGLAGHPITLDVCVDNNDPGKGTDCANQMIRDNVAAVAIGSNGILETEWKILHDAGIPVVNHSATNTAVLKDPKSTFILYDPNAQTVTLPISVAQRAGVKKISLIVVDFPTATDLYKQQSTKDAFTKAGIQWNLITVPLGQADLTPQAQQVMSSNPDGVVAIIGSDVTCIPALNALHELGFYGTTTAISYCITDAMRKAVPGQVIKGMRFGSEAPIGEASDRSMQQYAAILNKYVKSSSVAIDDLNGITAFQSVSAIAVGSQDLKGSVTPASVTSAMKSMKNAVLPAAGGRIFRCNGQATPQNPAVCSVSTLTGTLDATGHPTGYTLDNNQPIGG